MQPSSLSVLPQANLSLVPSSSETGPTQTFNRRSVIPRQPHRLWQVESGIIKEVTWLEDGTVVTLGLWGPGDLVGHPLCRIEPYHLQCLTAVSAIPLSPDNWQLYQTSLLHHLQQSQELLLLRSHYRTEEALLKLLSWLAQRFGRTVDQGQLIELRLTHQDLAELLGATRVTVTRLLRQLEEQQIIQRLPKQITLLTAEITWYYQI